MNQKQHYLGRVTAYPFCHYEILYAWLSGMGGPHLHFYANDNNDVLVRAAWYSDIEKLLRQDKLDDSFLLDKINTLLKGLPNTSSKYSVWSNIKCPHCRNEFPYRFKGNLRLRLEDPVIILINGCQLDTDKGVFIVKVDNVDKPTQ
jgi:hypothetical protein